MVFPLSFTELSYGWPGCKSICAGLLQRFGGGGQGLARDCGLDGALTHFLFEVEEVQLCPTVDPDRADCPGRIICPATGEPVCIDRCPLRNSDAKPLASDAKPSCCQP